MKKLIVAAEQLSIAAPKVSAYDRIVDSYAGRAKAVAQRGETYERRNYLTVTFNSPIVFK